MVEVLDSRKNYQQVTRQSSLENLRQAEKNTPGRLREVFGTEVSLKNGEVKMDELKANKEADKTKLYDLCTNTLSSIFEEDWEKNNVPDYNLDQSIDIDL